MSRAAHWLLIIAGTVIVLAITAVIALAMIIWSMVGENSFSQSAAGPIITQVLNGTLKPNPAGVVTLPSSLAFNSRNGKIYVTVDPAGTTWILFPTWRGKGDNLRAYLYRSTPASGPPPAEIKVIGPDLGPPFATPIPYKIDRQLGPNWYYVAYDMD